jgi:hypothetical protein
LTNFEWIKSLDLTKLAKLFCDHLECHKCPVGEYCSFGKNGMIEWLKAGDEFG